MVRPLVRKVQAIQEQHALTTKWQVRQFLWLVGYYRLFIPNFATVAAPLTNLLTNNKPVHIQWTHEGISSPEGRTLSGTRAVQP